MSRRRRIEFPATTTHTPRASRLAWWLVGLGSLACYAILAWFGVGITGIDVGRN